MRKLSVITLCLAVLGGGVTTEAQAEADRVGYGEKISRKISKHIRGTHHCQMKMDRPRTKVRLLFTKQSIPRRRYVLRVWIERHDDVCDSYRKYRRQRASLGVPSWFWNIAMCIHRGESGNWYESYYSGTIYGGGLQYHPSTWIAAGGLKFAPTAFQATPAQQVRAAYNLTSGGKNSLLHVHWEAQNHCF